ncbi:Sodium:neurotransmitter symporter family protein [Acanthocheilonema viteae]
MPAEKLSKELAEQSAKKSSKKLTEESIEKSSKKSAKKSTKKSKKSAKKLSKKLVEEEDGVALEKQILASRKGITFFAKTEEDKIKPERFENITKAMFEEAEVEQFVGIDDYTVQRIRQQFTQTTFRFANYIDHIFITLSLIVTVGNMLRFPIVCSESGGILFFIPYVLCLIFITTPIIYLENAIGQYSSLPSIELFQHLCPAFGGIGVAMLSAAICKTLLLSYSIMGIFYMFKSIIVAFSSTSQTTWLECVYESHSSCYDPYVNCNKAVGNYQYYSNCYNLFNNQTKLNSNYTWEQIVTALTSTSEALREFPPNIYWMEKINKAGTINEFFFASATIEHAIIAVIAIFGIRFYAKIARFVLIFPQFCMLVCIIYAIAKAGYRNTFASIAEGFSPDLQKLLDFKVWVIAALQAIIATNLLDGTYITLAAMKDFRNNFMRDTFLVIIYIVIINLFGCFFVFSVSGAAVELMFPMSIGKGLTMLWKHGENIYFIVLSILFAKTSFGAIVLSFTFFAFFVTTIGAQIVIIEMIIMIVYRTVIRIKFIEQTTSRNIIICIQFLFMHLSTYIYRRLTIGDIKVRYFYFSLLLPILAFLELLTSIHIYYLKRLIVNLHTMLGGPPNNFWRYLGYPVNWYWTACWYIITPAFCIISVALALFTIISGRLHSDIITLTLITLLPLSVIIIPMLIHVLKAYRTGKTIKSLFVADHRWAPELGINRQQALYEERAARAII